MESNTKRQLEEIASQLKAVVDRGEAASKQFSAIESNLGKLSTRVRGDNAAITSSASRTAGEIARMYQTMTAAGSKYLANQSKENLKAVDKIHKQILQQQAELRKAMETTNLKAGSPSQRSLSAVKGMLTKATSGSSGFLPPFPSATATTGGSGVGGAAEAVKTLSPGFMQLAVVATAAGAALTGLFIAGRQLFNQMTTTESQLVRLKTAFKSEALAVEEYTKSVMYAAKTPFKVGEVVESAAILKVFQLDAFKKLAGDGRMLIDVLGDMAGATGSDLATATWALYRAQVGEWEIMQNNFQINARSIPQLKGLTTGTKEYGEAIVQYLAKQERFIGGQWEASQTIKGLLSNITDAVDITRIFAAGVADAKHQLRGATLYDSVRNALRSIYDVVTPGDIMTQLQQAEVLMKSADRVKREAGQLDLNKLSGKYSKEDLDFVRKIISDTSIKDYQYKLDQIRTHTKIAFEDVYSRGEQLQNVGRVIGQGFRAIFEIAIAPGLRGIGSLLDDGLKKFNRWFLLSNGIQKGMGKTFDGSTFESFKRSLVDLGQQTGNTSLRMSGSAEEMAFTISQLSQDTQRRLREMSLASTTETEKAMLVFAIKVEFFILYIKRLFAPIGEFFSKIKEAFSQSTAWNASLAQLGQSFSDLMDVFSVFNGVEGPSMGLVFQTLTGLGTGFLLTLTALVKVVQALAGAFMTVVGAVTTFIGVMTGSDNLAGFGINLIKGGAGQLGSAFSMSAFNKVVATDETAQKMKQQELSQMRGDFTGGIPADKPIVSEAPGWLTWLARSQGGEAMLPATVLVKNSNEQTELLKQLVKERDGKTVGIPGKAIGSWRMPWDQTVNVHRGEMIVPADVASRIRGETGRNTSFAEDAEKSSYGIASRISGEGGGNVDRSVSIAMGDIIVNVPAGTTDAEGIATHVRQSAIQELQNRLIAAGLV